MAYTYIDPNDTKTVIAALKSFGKSTNNDLFASLQPDAFDTTSSR